MTDVEIYNAITSIKNDYNNILKDNHRNIINMHVLELLDKPKWSNDDIKNAKEIIEISNDLYNNTDTDLLILDDGIYDLLLESYRIYDVSIQSGAKPKPFKRLNNVLESAKDNLIIPVYYISEEEQKRIDNMIYDEIIFKEKKYTTNELLVQPVYYEHSNYDSKKYAITEHVHPELVGTLNKCKYVLDVQAEEMGVYNTPSVKILERDWLRPISEQYNLYNDNIDIIASLKYDGISIEATVSDTVITAITRGDTDNNVGVDLTNILGGYRFPNAPRLDEPIGMKFEAIITHDNLIKFNNLMNYNYKNCRTAIIGLLGRNDAWLYRDLITLIPLQSTLKDDDGNPLDRLIEIEFLNKCYTKDQLFRYSILSGNYVNILFQIKLYTEEAEFSRSILPFMYDGVVFELYDQSLRESIGRKDSKDLYKMAVKFNPLKRMTIFRGFMYTIGQNGVITPMVIYDPVEFFGTIHYKSSISSYKRFIELDLNIGDIIDIEYRHDVMPYVSKPRNPHNYDNHRREKVIEEVFPTVCPFCSEPLEFTDKSAYCVNPNCRERSIKRLTNMIDKLGIKDIGEEAIRKLNNTYDCFTLSDLYSINDIILKEALGEITGTSLYQQLLSLQNNMNDYIIIGALGFSGLAQKTFKIIFPVIPLHELFNRLLDKDPNIYYELSSIKNIGEGKAKTIIDEFPLFRDDIAFILDNFNLINTVYNDNTCTVRFTGFRDNNLVNKLVEMGYDADGDAGVTKSTDILLVPYKDYNSGNKVQKALKYGIQIIPVNEFKSSLNLS